jgi:hypothetical protein
MEPSDALSYSIAYLSNRAIDAHGGKVAYRSIVHLGGVKVICGRAGENGPAKSAVEDNIRLKMRDGVRPCAHRVLARHDYACIWHQLTYDLNNKRHAAPPEGCQRADNYVIWTPAGSDQRAKPTPQLWRTKAKTPSVECLPAAMNNGITLTLSRSLTQAVDKANIVVVSLKKGAKLKKAGRFDPLRPGQAEVNRRRIYQQYAPPGAEGVGMLTKLDWNIH